MDNNEAVNELVALIGGNNSLTSKQIDAINLSIANMQSWDVVKDKLLISLYKGNGDASFQRGVRYSLVVVDDAVSDKLDNLKKVC